MFHPYSLLAALLSVASTGVAPAEIELKKESRQLTGFEDESVLGSIKLNSSEVRIVEEGASEGNKALHLKFNPPAGYPSVNFRQEPPADFRGYGGIAFNVYNPSEDTVAFAVRIDSSNEADGNGNHSRSGSGTIDGKQRITYVIPFGVSPSALKMKALPGFGDFRSLGSLGSGPFDLGHVVTWQIFMNRPQSVQELIVDNVRLIPGRKHDFNGIIDKYGQFTREVWPGKVLADADFAKQLKDEEKDLAEHKGAKSRDKFGGWVDGPQLEATGFFRTAKYKGKWSLVDPEGRLFLSFGPTTITNAATTPLKDREYMFAALPPAEPFLEEFVVGEDKSAVDFLSANLKRKYGEDYKAKWYDHTYERLISWGFNSIGAFASWDTLKNGKVPYTVTVWPGGKHARLSTGKEQVRSMHDPFDPIFAEDVANAIKPQSEKVKDDPYCIGYFVGNEEDWGHFRAGPRSHYGLVLSAFKSPADKSPAKRAFLAQLKQKYGEIAGLNSAWATSFADWEAMSAPVTFKDPYGEILLADFSMLLQSFADQYFRVVQQELKKADPNHLYLGCRFAGYSPEVLKAAEKYSDVLSFNVYRLAIDPKEWAVLDDFDRPVIIGEFHFGATDRGVFDVGLVGVADQEGRGRAYQRYLRSVLDHPKFVGAHWFQYTDQPATGRGLDGENGNVGFVSITDTPHPELIKAAREIHDEMYDIRFGK